MAACVSVLSIVGLSVKAGIAATRPIIQGWKGRKDSKEALFFRTQLGAYVTCLLLANLMSGIAGFFEFLWASRGGIASGKIGLAISRPVHLTITLVSAGPLCTAQGR